MEQLNKITEYIYKNGVVPLLATINILLGLSYMVFFDFGLLNNCSQYVFIVDAILVIFDGYLLLLLAKKWNADNGKKILLTVVFGGAVPYVIGLAGAYYFMLIYDVVFGGIL